ncbi:hypothetical protein DXG01_014231 [Tephrocybe rancida]|nr:hypothetical protein DXG01_014231 [Tephrocybe rancida]
MPGSPSLSNSPVVRADIDRNTLLCFACSSSLPPLKKSSPGFVNGDTSISSSSVFTTPCCRRVICLNCITTNPRLQRYNPCLACLGGVGVVRSPPLGSTPLLGRPNLDGAMRDEDTFVLGDGDDSDYEDEKEGDSSFSPDVPSTTPLNPQGTFQTVSVTAETTVNEDAEAPITLEPAPLKYYIAQSDTLQGIVLRYGLDGHELCRLNNLPPSTLRTTPHLLHTRRFLILPPSARKAGVPVNQETPEQAAAREASQGKERAEKRLQTLTKEVDWRVAKAYVALADDPVEEVEEQEEWERKRKESGSGSSARPSNLEDRAIRKYLDDDEWEENQRRQGSKASLSEKAGGSSRRWWRGV